MRLLDLPGMPRRTIFTAARTTSAHAPGIVAVRTALEAAVATEEA